MLALCRFGGFNLRRARAVLRDALSHTNSWAYVVERSGARAGHLVASTVVPAVATVGGRAGGLADISFTFPPERPMFAVGTTTLAQSVLALERLNWPEGHFNRLALGYSVEVSAFHKCYLKARLPQFSSCSMVESKLFNAET